MPPKAKRGVAQAKPKSSKYILVSDSESGDAAIDLEYGEHEKENKSKHKSFEHSPAPTPQRSRPYTRFSFEQSDSNLAQDLFGDDVDIRESIEQGRGDLAAFVDHSLIHSASSAEYQASQ